MTKQQIFLGGRHGNQAFFLCILSCRIRISWFQGMEIVRFHEKTQKTCDNLEFCIKLLKK